MDELVFARESSWFPSVIRQDGELRIHLIGGADALHDPRTFTFPIEAAHLTVIRTSLARHLLLYCALTPLANAAGIGGPLDESAALALLDPILLSTDDEVDRFFWKNRWDKRLLVAHGANIRLLGRVQLVAAVRHATPNPDWSRVHKYLGR